MPVFLVLVLMAWPLASQTGGPATAAILVSVSDIKVDAGGNLFIADFSANHRIRKLAPDSQP